MPSKRIKPGFIEPMLLLRTEELPLGDEWLYELKLDGYRAVAIKTGGKLYLRSRNDNDFSQRSRDILSGLASLPSDTVIDGEIVALDKSGKPLFNTLQNYGSSRSRLYYYIFDVMVLNGSEGRDKTRR